MTEQNQSGKYADYMTDQPPKPDDNFQQLSQRPRSSLVADFWFFLKHNKKWWLLPILVMVLLLGLLVILGSSAIAPFIYPLF